MNYKLGPGNWYGNVDFYVSSNLEHRWKCPIETVIDLKTIRSIKHCYLYGLFLSLDFFRIRPKLIDTVFKIFIG
jgi:hypothetical protein